MKRDWDFIREILIDIENEEDTFKKHNNTETELKYAGHIRMLAQEGLINGIEAIQGIGGHWSFAQNNPHLSMSGHDLLETLRSQSLWQKVKEKSKETGIELTVDTIKALAASATKAMLAI